MKGFEGIYQVSDLGRVKALERIDVFPCMFNGTKTGVRREIILKPRLHSGGYHRVCFGFGKRVDYYIHRIVAEHFHDNPENKKEVNHINCIKTDNRAVNLEWATRGENAKHASKSGLLKHSLRITNSTLDEIQVRTIRSIGSLLTNRELGLYFGVSGNAISNVNIRKTWRHI